MKQSIFTIIENTPLTKDVMKMVLQGDTSAITASGQFVNIKLEGKFLRRPISVCDYDGTTLTITFAKATNVFQSAELSSQTRINSIDVYTA